MIRNLSKSKLCLLQILFLITVINFNLSATTHLFGGPDTVVQKPNLAHLENLMPVEPASRITDLIDSKFYDGSIKSSDLSSSVASNGAMYTLANPGRYYISGNIIASPINSSVTAIRITANNVMLDLNRATLSQGNTTAGAIGIELASGVTNVIIQNGRINNFYTYGIQINSGTSNIILRDIIISNMQHGNGINVTSSNSIYLLNIKILSSIGFGLVATNCNNLLAQNSNFDYNQLGLILISCNQSVFENCTANNNIGLDVCYGMTATASTNCWFKNCQAAYNQATSVNNSYGFYLTGNSFNIRFTDCAAYGQIGGTGSTNFAAGFYFKTGTSNSILENSYSYGNGAGATYAGYGIYFGNGSTSGPTNCIVRNCQIYDNFGATKSYGFYDFASTTSTILTHNVVSGNGAINPSAGNFTPTSANNANYVITYSQSPANNTNNLFLEGNLTAIGGINSTGILGDYQNLSIIVQ